MTNAEEAFMGCYQTMSMKEVRDQLSITFSELGEAASQFFCFDGKASVLRDKVRIERHRLNHMPQLPAELRNQIEFVILRILSVTETAGRDYKAWIESSIEQQIEDLHGLLLLMFRPGSVVKRERVEELISEHRNELKQAATYLSIGEVDAVVGEIRRLEAMLETGAEEYLLFGDFGN